MQNIGHLAYKVKFDARELTHGTMSSRKQLAEYKKILADSQTPLQRYAHGLENLRVMTAKFPELLKHQARVQRDLEKQYLQSEAAVRDLTRAERARLHVLTAEDRAKKLAEASQRRLNRSRAEARQMIERHRSPAEAYRRGLAATNRLLRQGVIDTRTYRAEVARLNSERRGGSGGMGFAGIGKATAALGGLWIGKRFLQEAIRTHAEIERSTAAMEVFTGSAEGAVDVMANLRSLAARGVSFQALQDGAATMMSFGVSVEQTLPALRQMAEVTRGDKDRLRSMALAFAQAGAAGKLMGQDLLQMINAGFNPLVQISKTTGKSMAQLRKEMENGSISFQMILDALQATTEAGGQHVGMLDKIEKTTAGALSKTGAQWEIFKDKFGTLAAPATQKTLKETTRLLDFLNATMDKFNGDGGKSMADREIANQKARAQALGNPTHMNNQSLTLAARSNQLDQERLAFLEKWKDKFAKLQQTADELKQKRLDAEKQVEQAKKPPEPTTAGTERIRKLQIELGILDKQKAYREDLLKDGLNEKEADRVMQLERQLELMKKQKEQAKGMAFSLGEMMVTGLQKAGVLSTDKSRAQREEIERRRAVIDSIPAQSSPNAARGSQAAYEIITGVQNVRANMELKGQRLQLVETKKQTTILAQVKTVLDSVQAKLAELESE